MKTSFFVNCPYTYACYHNASTLNVILCLKLTIKTSELCHWRRSGVFTVNFKHISHLFPVSIVEFEHVNGSWVMILPKEWKMGKKVLETTTNKRELGSDKLDKVQFCLNQAHSCLRPNFTTGRRNFWKLWKTRSVPTS